MNREAWIKWIVVAALGIAALYLYHPRLRNSDIRLGNFESFNLAQALVEHRGFSDPFEPMRTGPSAHLAPLYPAYLAAVMSTFGTGASAANVLVWSAALLLAAQLMLFPMLAESLGLGFWTGVISALAWFAAGIPPIFLWESTMAGLLVVGIAFLMGKSLAGRMSAKAMLLSGVLWGTLLLLQPVALAVLPFWLLLVYARSRNARRTMMLALLPVLLVCPWIARNFAVFHRVVFLRDNFGLELAVSNNPCASALFEANDASGCWAQTHPNYNRNEAVKVLGMGEVEYNRAKLGEAKRWMVENPARFAALTAQRMIAFWFPPQSLNKGNGIIWRPLTVQIFTLLSFPGLFLMWRNARSACYVAGLWLVFFPLTYYFIQFMDRYRYPIFWVTFLCGSYFIVEIVRGLAGTRRAPREKEPDLTPDREVA